MREIKFRAWDIKNNKMIRSVGFSDSDCGRVIHCEAYMVGGGETYSIWSGKETLYELMQFTGLFDKNGKEIFEGDILKAESGFGEYSISEVDYCALVGLTKRLVEIGTQHLEIIGNIYSNPDLLNDK